LYFFSLTYPDSLGKDNKSYIILQVADTIKAAIEVAVPAT